MSAQIFLPGPTPTTVRTPSGQILPVPAGWALLPPGDAALTRRVKAAGDHWLVQEKVGRKIFSRVKGQRREVRRMLAQRSKELLGAYRRGEAIAPACPLARALSSPR